MAPVRAALLLGVPPTDALFVVDRTLANNPYLADLVSLQMRLRLANGDTPGALASFQQLRALAPQARLVRAICAGNPDCPVQFAAGAR